MQAELSYLKAASEELEEYLLSSQLFWQLSGDLRKDNTLTPGNLLLIEKRVAGIGLQGKDQTEFERLWGLIEKIITAWQTHWNKKAAQEFEVRLRNWGIYLGELHEEQGKKSAQYRNEVKNRVILQLLLNFAGKNIENQSKGILTGLDLRLRGYSNPGDFLWDRGLEKVFPRDEFWFLAISFEKG
jgi:hypothetical protein